MNDWPAHRPFQQPTHKRHCEFESEAEIIRYGKDIQYRKYILIIIIVLADLQILLVLVVYMNLLLSGGYVISILKGIEVVLLIPTTNRQTGL